MPRPSARGIRPLIFCVLAAAPRLFAASPPTDVAALEQRVASGSAADRENALIELSNRLERIDPKRALDYARRARAEAKIPNDELRSLARIGSLQRVLGDYVGAMATARDGLNWLATAPNDAMRARFLVIIGRVQWDLTNLPEAISAFQDALALCAKTNHPSVTIDAHIGFGLTYAEIGRVDDARREFEAARALALQQNDKGRMGDALTDLGDLCLREKDDASAKAYYEGARTVYAGEGDTLGAAAALVNLGTLAQDTGDPSTALSDYGTACEIYRKLGVQRYLADGEKRTGEALTALARGDEALAHLNAGLRIAQDLGSRALLAGIYGDLVRLYELRDDYRSALDAQQREDAENEAALGDRASQRIGELNARYDSARQQQEIDLLKSEEAADESELGHWRRQRVLLIGALSLCAACMVVYVGRRRIALQADRRVLAKTIGAKKAAEQAGDVKTRLLGIASHDIRGPLANIQRIAEDLRAERGGAAPDERIEWIESEAARLIRLVQDLLDTAALESGRMSLRKAPFDLSEVIHATIAEQSWLVAEKRQTIVFQDPPAGTGWVDGDRDRLRQVIGNLVGNAVKYGPKEKPITIELARADSAVRVSVRDQGPGLSKEDCDRLFAPFSPLSARPTGRETSHGLGLFIAREIVRLHGGRIWVESKPGAGAAFSVEIPAASAPA